MRESQILDQQGEYWLADDAGQYTVYRDGVTAARADSSYPRTPDGLSLARARLAYLTRCKVCKGPTGGGPPLGCSRPEACPECGAIGMGAGGKPGTARYS